MALVCSTGGAGAGACCMRGVTRQARSRRALPSFSPLLLVSLLRSKDGGGGVRRGAAQVVCARRGLSSRTRRLEDRGKKGGLTTKPSKEELEGKGGGGGGSEVGEGGLPSSSSVERGFVDGAMSTSPMPELPGLTPDFWEGSKWDAFGFVVQYLWAFGIGFALIACGIAVATYNEGATDFKQTPVYKESIQSRDLLEDPDSSGSDVFEANPTEEAPSVE